MNLYSNGVYFVADGESYSYVAHCLADGLSQLGIPIFSNISYVNERISDFIFEVSPDPSVLQQSYYVVYDIQDICNHFKFIPINMASGHPRAAAICMEDEISNLLVPAGMPLFCTHENRFRTMAGNRIPICFGVSQKMIDNSLVLPSWDKRMKAVLKSFRPSERQDVRAMMELLFLPQVSRHWDINATLVGGGRWDPVFFDYLKNTQIAVAYGGTFNQDFRSNPAFFDIPSYRLFRSMIEYRAETVVVRWDSWRLWESLVAGCVTIHIDFDFYGFKLPVMPENWKHYIGLNLSSIKEDVKKMLDTKDQLEEIARNGRLWAIENYSPVAVARRFIETMKTIYPSANSLNSNAN